MTPTDRRQVAVASGINVLLGLWLIISPWILGYSSHYKLTDNAVLVGALVVVLAGYRVMTRRTAGWVSLIFTAGLGLWLIVAPLFLRDGGDAAGVWNAIVVGIVITAFAVWSGWASETAEV